MVVDYSDEMAWRQADEPPPMTNRQYLAASDYRKCKQALRRWQTSLTQQLADANSEQRKEIAVEAGISMSTVNRWLTRIKEGPNR